ncbi:DUF3265 domain-containing protein [Vibrio parahaemolyticus]|nr:DUF3265 domain-containing protein [Vibrio parahaemolyticus]NCM80683.1 DUF3265 domain-containing protein [Vibrio parahaemolyticus]
MRNAWRFHYALILVIEVVCGNIVLRCSPLKRALGAVRNLLVQTSNFSLAICSSFRQFGFIFLNS